jgi:Trypsin-like peptidase domain/Domain of unknown function (DUF4384)
MDIDSLKNQLAPIVFRLEWQWLNTRRHGTGFFISREGLALTAYHNLAEALDLVEAPENAEEPITVKWQGKAVPMYWKLPAAGDAEWQRRLDVAVLEARPPIHIETPVCGLAYLDSSWSRQERAQRWKGRPIALMGYPRDYPKEAKLVVGTISADEPIVDPKIQGCEDKPAGYADQALGLGVDFQQNVQYTLTGVSGAPLLDRDTSQIVGIQFSAMPPNERVFATEFCHVAKAWPPFEKLARAIPKPAPPRPRLEALSLFGISFLALTAGAIIWLGVLWQQSTPAGRFLKTRPGRAVAAPEYQPVEPAQPALAQDAILGVTLWRLRPSAPSDGASVRLRVHDPETNRPAEWTPERVQSGYRFADGDYVRLGIESPRRGYLYVIDREQRSDGTFTRPTLIFPTLRIRGGDNQVFAGRLTEIPGESDTPPYLTLRLGGPSQTGERLSIVIAPEPLPGVTILRDYQAVTPEQFESWRRWLVPTTRQELKGGAGRTWTTAERAAGHQGERSLRQEEPAPQTLYRIPAAAGRPFLVEIPLDVRRATPASQ